MKTAKGHTPVDNTGTNRVDGYEKEVEELLDVLAVSTAYVSDLSMVTDFYTSQEGEEEGWLRALAEELRVDEIGLNEYVWQLAERMRIRD